MSSQQRVRVSVANLVPCFPETGNSCFFGILNPTIYNKEKRRQYQALGGGTLLTLEGKQRLEVEFDAQDLTHGLDARFTIPAFVLERVLSLFELRDPRICENTPNREVVGELSRMELDGIDPVLAADEVRKLSFGYLGSVRQPVPEAGSDTSPLANKLPTHRLFHRFVGQAPQAVLAKMKASAALRVFTQAELALTDGGRHGATLAGGITIANNLFPL